MYDLIESFKKLGKDIQDTVTGKKVAVEIENQLQVSRSLNGFKLEPLIILEALRLKNHLDKYLISERELEEMIKYHVMGGSYGNKKY